MEEFDIKAINYTQGEENVAADALSRYFKNFICPDSNYTVPLSIIPEKILTVLGNVNIGSLPELIKLKSSNFAEWYRALPYYQSTDPEIQIAADTQKTDRVTIDEEHYYCLRGRDEITRTYVPAIFRRTIIEFYHEDALHPGINKTVTIIHRYFDWPGCKEDVMDYISKCDLCKMSKRRAMVPYGEMHNVLATNRGDLLAIHIFGPLPIGRYGLEKIIVVLDVFTRFVRLYPMKKAKTSIGKIYNCIWTTWCNSQ